MADTCDALIVGAGIIGCSIAFGLSVQGKRVTVIDKLPAAGYGSTSSSAAVIRTYYSTLPSTKLAWEALHHWRDYEAFMGVTDERGMISYTETGSLFLRTDAEDGLEKLLVHQDALGIRWEAWDVARLTREMPWLDRTGYGPPRRHDDPEFGEPSDNPITRALYFPDSGYVSDPQLTAHNFQAAAEAHGTRFRFNTAVAEFVVRDGRAVGVQLDGGEVLEAQVVVNAGGPWSLGLNRLAGVDRGMNVSNRPLRQEVCHVPLPKSIPSKDQGGVALIADPSIGTYARPDVGDTLMIGSMEPACDPVVWEDDPDDFNRSHSEQWTAQVYRQALRMPDLLIPGQATGVVDLYDVSDDWMPIYDKSDLPGFYMACGTSGNQFKNAPVAGQLMAGLIDWCESGHDHDREPYSFPCRYTGGEIDISAFSRKREIAATTGTVIG